MLTTQQLTAIVWSAVFSADLILFSAHPVLFSSSSRTFFTNLATLPTSGAFADPLLDQLFNSAGILLTTQAILILQPTHSPSQKHLGTNIHATLNLTAFASLIAGLVIIEYNKFAHHAPAHFNSTHGILGLVTYVLLVVQVLIGLAQFYTPSLFGSVNNAKSIYKYHRMSGYLILVMFFATVYAATYTAFNIDKLHIQLWAVVVASVLVLVGVVPRIKKQKLGL